MHSNTVLNAVGISIYYQCFQKMDFMKNVLTAPEQARVFGWPEGFWKCLEKMAEEVFGAI